MADKPVLVVTHVPWEGPHRIADALRVAGLALEHRRPVDGDPLPAVDDVAAAVFMGGPMNVDETDRYPALAAEREWLAEAVAADLPVLGVCLGSQLIARALGADVLPGDPEIGWKPVEIHEPDDLLLGGLTPDTPVLHWHGDRFDLPPDAVRLASSDATEVQAFRVRNAWGVLFHAEADATLTEAWLAEATMAQEATRANGEDAVATIQSAADEHHDTVKQASEPGFANFAALAARR